MDRLYTLLLVEDEDDVRRALADEAKWRARGYTLVGAAASAAEALALSQVHRPDVILTDIQMPEVSGLELLTYLVSHGADSEYVILSGYSQFEYAQQAVRLGVFDYLTKPVDPRKFDETFARLRRKLDRRGGRAREGVSGAAAQRLFRGVFLVSLITQRVSPVYLRVRMSELELGAPAPGYFLLAAEFDGLAGGVAAFADALIDYFEARGQMCAVYQGRLIAFLGVADEAACENLLRGAETVLRARPEGAAARARAGLSPAFGDLGDAGIAYRRALRALAHHFYQPAFLLRYEQACAGEEALDECGMNRRFLEIADALCEMDLSAALRAMDEQFNCFARERPRDVERVLRAGKALSALLLARVERMGIAVRDLEARLQAGEGSRPSSLAEMNRALRGLVATLHVRLAEQASRQRGDIACQAMDYVQRHIDQPLTVADVAAGIHVSASYLSRAYKKATGGNLNNAINGQKCARARELLRASGLSVQQISFQLGFGEYRYFCTLFKKVTGVTPLAYRRSLLRGGMDEP